MLEWLEQAAGPDYAPAVLWTLIALAALFLVLLTIRVIRNMTHGTYVAGGRNRKTRLAVMDATPIDSHRRLVLIRRDDVEHLILIGGGADIVVERDIRLAAQVRRPAPAPAAEQPAAAEAAVPLQRQRPPEAAPRTPPPTRLPQPPARIQREQPAPRPAPPSPEPSRPVAAANENIDEIDETLMKELEVSLDDIPVTRPPAPAPKVDTISLDEEMTKLLGELSSHKR